MKTSHKRLLPGLVLGLVLGIAAGGLPGNAIAKGGKGEASSASTSLDAAVADVQERTGGRVLRASRKGSQYIIKVLMPSGVVKTFRVNAQ